MKKVKILVLAFIIIAIVILLVKFMGQEKPNDNSSRSVSTSIGYASSQGDKSNGADKSGDGTVSQGENPSISDPASEERKTEVPLEDVLVLVEEIESEMTEKGWKEIDQVEGDVDNSRWSGFCIEDALDAEVLYTVIGKTDGWYGAPIYNVVKVSHCEQDNLAIRENPFYATEKGQYWGGEAVKDLEMQSARSLSMYYEIYAVQWEWEEYPEEIIAKT